MNVLSKKRKRPSAQRYRDYLDFNRINPIGVEAAGQAQGILDNQNNANEYSFTTLATRGNSVVKQSSTYVSITSGRGYAHGEVGIAYIDIESPSVNLIQLSDDPWYSALLMKIHIIDPCEIILPHTLYDAKPETADGKLIKFIREDFPKLPLITVPRRHFSETDGLTLITKYCSDKYKYVKEEIALKYYALSAASGLLKYLQFHLNIYFKENGLKLDFETKFAHMQIDIDTSYKLELMSQNNPNTVKSNFPSLYKILDHCKTSLGQRTLRARILEPMCDITSINDIHDCIAELNQPEYQQLKEDLISVLGQFNNVDRLYKLALVVPQDNNLRAAEILINQALHLQKCLALVPSLEGRLVPLTSKVFQEIKVNLMDQRYVSILNHIDTVINKNIMQFHKDSTSQLVQRINCIQSGHNNLVDILRKTFNELSQQLDVCIGEMSSKYGQAFKRHYSVQRGFHVILLIANHAVTLEFPDEIEVFDSKRNTCYLTTPEVKKLNIRIQDIIEEITLQSNIVIAQMLNGIMKEIDAVYDLSGYTATLDIILSYATASANNNFVRPTFSDEMRIVDAIHPLLEKNIHRTIATPNNIIATPEYNFFIITGPNMGGKTVYIKTIAILQIMAQIGCYVPAKSAQFRITDRIFSRMGFNDSIQKNLSTFMMEMNNIEHILKNVTSNSLVIIDELCRSTNPKEGSQLAWNICEHLASIRGTFNDGKYFVNESNQMCDNDNGTVNGGVSVEGASTTTRSSTLKNTNINVITAPFIFLTTHFHSLTKLSDPFFNVVNLSFSAEQITNNESGGHSLVYNHRIQEGVTTGVTSYGLAIAKTVRFPADIMAHATELNQRFISGENSQNMTQNRPKRKLSNIGRQILHLNQNLRVMSIDDVASVISNGINTAHRRRRRHFGAPSERTTSTTSTEYEDHLKIDRILYNAYGDISSLIRNTTLDWTLRYNDEINEDVNLSDAQNIAIQNFLVTFVEEHQDGLIEALGNLSLSNEMPEPLAPAPAPASQAQQNNVQDEISPMNPNIERDPDELSSILSVQRLIVPNVELSGINSFTSKAAKISTPSRLSFSPKTPPRSETSSRPPSSASKTFTMRRSLFDYNDSQSSFSSFQTKSRYSSSSSSSFSTMSSPMSLDDSFFIQPTQLNNFGMNFDFSQRNNTQSSFNEPTFMRSQSQNDLCTLPGGDENIFSSKYFSQADGFDDFEARTPKLPSSPPGSRPMSRSSQHSRPDLSRIRQMSGRSLVNLPTASNSGRSSASSSFGKFTMDSSFRGNSRLSNSSDHEKAKRKVPLIRKAKLKTSSVFGDTSKIFATPAPEKIAAIPKPKPPPANQNQFNVRQTDTSFTATMQRLQRIQARKHSSGTNANNTVNQPNPPNRLPSIPQINQQQADADEQPAPPLTPPPGFQ
ncbi:mutS protein homolog 4-like [Contarinia nasturtii]|uniref:mutS protein homolog 4-like n=1 Tax=Contarinia nasturtii TaxID=265458 RepID=UPI0012D37B16|nr:mutS protein homolog 4-like [Contarinia nasturtii]